MHLYRAGFVLFALFVSMNCLNQRNGVNKDCLLDESNEKAENNKVIPGFSLLLRAFHIPSRETYSQNCTNHRFRLIELGLNNLQQRLTALETNTLLRSSLADAREAFDDVFYVYDSMKIFWKVSGPSEEAEVMRECDRHSPKNALINMARKASYSSKLFQSIVNGSRYSEEIFNETVSVITTEVAICAILAAECDKFLHSDSFDGPAQEMRNERINISLTTIEREINVARQMLTGNFGRVVVDIIYEALDHIDYKGIGRHEGVKYVYKVLSAQFTNRAWAVTIYKSIHQQAVSVHTHESTTDNWFYVNNEHHTAVAHYAEKRTNCTFSATNLLQMTLRQIIGDKDNYKTFVKQDDKDFGLGIPLLKNALKQLNGGSLPDNLFISITKYHQSFSIAREYEYHFFEQVIDEDTGRVIKTVLIGWC